MSVVGKDAHRLLSQLLYFEEILDACVHVMTEIASSECDEDYTVELMRVIVGACDDLNSRLRSGHFRQEYAFRNSRTGRKATITIDIETDDLEKPREVNLWDEI